MLKSFDQSNDPQYRIAMFRHHWKAIKNGIGISQYDDRTDDCYRVTTYQELSESLFLDLDTKIKDQIKKEVGL